MQTPIYNPRPGFTITRCCFNCKFFKESTKRNYGFCEVQEFDNKKGELLNAHTSSVCQRHVWKPDGKFTQYVSERIGAECPAELLQNI